MNSLFGVGRLKDYTATSGKRTNIKVRILVNTGLFLLILPYILPLLLNLIDRVLFPVSYHVYPVVIFIYKTMAHFFIAIALFAWAIKTAWDHKEEMVNTPVFKTFINHFSSLTMWGWGFYVFLALTVAGYIFIMVDEVPDVKPNNSVVTVIRAGDDSADQNIKDKPTTTAERNDTIKAIHGIYETRMMVTLADGTYRGFQIPFIISSKGWNGYLFKSISSN